MYSDSQTYIVINLDDPNARVYFDRRSTTGSGLQRTFVTPPLADGSYKYEVDVVWPDGSNETRVVSFRSGESTTIDFKKPVVRKDVPKVYESVSDTPPVEKNYGLERDKISSEYKATFKGESVEPKVIESMIGQSMTDDSKWPIVVILGATDADRKRALQDFLALNVGSEFRVQDYLQTDWPNEGNAYKTKSALCVVVQRADGAVLSRTDEYSGPETMKGLIEQARTKLRVPDPNYDPSKDPNPLAPFMPTNLPWSQILQWGLIALGLYLVVRKKQ